MVWIGVSAVALGMIDWILASAMAAVTVQSDPRLTLTVEKTNFVETGRYQEALAFCEALAELSPKAQVVNIGRSPQGRRMVALVVSENPGAVMVGENRGKKPLVFVQNGIHSGEIEGKDATLMLVRQLLGLGKGKEYPDYSADILQNVDLVIIPVFSVDGHERMNPYNRINQNGPKEMGWRGTAQGYNLNRDYVKADALEMRHLLELVTGLKPDFFIDNHTTDGGDWQYVVQFDVPKYPTMHQTIVDWSAKYEAGVMPQVDKAGYLTAPYFGGINQSTDTPMIRADLFGPRYSTGYMGLRNVPSLLVETHVLKEYKPRVLGTAEINYRTWEWCADHAAELLAARKQADQETAAWEAGDTTPISGRTGPNRVPWTFKGFEYKPYQSDVSGGMIPAWSSTKVEKEGVYLNEIVAGPPVTLPAGYLVPQEWTEVVDRLTLHGVEMVQLEAARQVQAGVTRFTEISFATAPYEGRFAPRFQSVVKVEPVSVRAGDYFVPVGQELGRLVVHMLEPEASDSFMKWGFFNTVFEQKEYAEAYAMEPYAKKMLAEDPALKAEFEKKLAEDEEFARSPQARLNWFFERSPYFDPYLNRYPVLRVMNDLR